MKGIGIGVLVLVAGCSDNRCGSGKIAATADAAVQDATIERIAVTTPDAAAADGAAADKMVADTGDGSSVSVSGTFNACPNIFAATASPPMAALGEPIMVNASAGDPESTPLTYLWTAPTGDFETPTAANTRYFCRTPGPQTLTLKVSDGACTEMTTVSVTCR